MFSVRFLPFLLALLFSSTLPVMAAAEARLVQAERGFLSAYAVIEYNGRTYRTDEMGSMPNKRLWNALSDQDKMKLARGYSYMQNEIRDHFGSDGQNVINSFVNKQTGWSDLVAAHKDRHAAKAYPALAAVFGEDAVLDIPVYSASCWSVRTSSEYLSAVRLEQEIRADYAVGRAVYKMLRDANWDQISVAVKGISGPLLKIIVDNFMTGFITHGASASSDLLVGLYNLQEELRTKITQQVDPRQAELTPRDLIERLDQFMEEMEVTGNTAARLVDIKCDQLRGLAETIAAMEQACAAAHREEADTVREELEERIGELPLPTPTPPGDAESQWSDTQRLAGELQTELRSILVELRDLRDSVPSVQLDENLYRFLDGFTSGFDGHYRALRTEMSEIDQWHFSPMPTAEEARALLQEIDERAKRAIDEALPRIDALEASAMGLDAYEPELGLLPSAMFRTYGLRQLGGFIDLVATAERTTESVTEDIVLMEDISAAATEDIAAGKGQRLTWLGEQKTRYDSLRFNFEASLSQHIASLRQLDRLHEEDPYYERSNTWSYKGATLYRYRVSRTHIWSEINAHANDVDKLAARQKALQRMVQLHAKETALLKRLDIARSFHENDRQQLFDFFTYLRRSYGFSDFVGADTRVIADFLSAIGATICLPDDLAAPLVSDVTDYLDVMGKWVRTASDMYVPIHAYDPYTQTPSIIEQLAGKTDSYFQLLDLYDQMRLEQSRLLALPLEDFNTYYSTTWTRIGALQEQMNFEGISAAGSPSRNIEYATYIRLGNLNSRYFGLPTEEEFQLVQGQVTTALGVGVSGITFLLTPGSFPSRVAVSGPDGRFLFEHVAPGPIVIKPPTDQNHVFTPTSRSITRVTSNQTVRFMAAPNANAGFCAQGAVVDDAGCGIGGVDVVARSEADAGVFRIGQTNPDGSFAFSGIAVGFWQVEPRAQGVVFVPESRRLEITACVGDLDFVASGNLMNVSLPVRSHGSDASDGHRVEICSDTESWTAHSDQSWIIIGDMSGTGDGVVVYALEALQGRSARSGTITIMSGLGVTRTVTITQAGDDLVLSFDAQGGTAAPAAMNVLFGTSYGPLAQSVRAGHTFAGWWTGAGGTGTRVLETTIVTVSMNHTLYAKWVLNGDDDDDPSEGAPSVTVGSFDGYFYAAENFAGETAMAVKGTLALKISSAAGRLTAKALLLGGTVSFSGKTWSEVAIDGTCTAALTSRSGETLDLYVRQNRIWGTLVGGKAGTAPLTLAGGRNRFADRSDAEAVALLEGFRGYYTISLPIYAGESLGDAEAAPKGVGYLAVTVGTKGAAKVAGVLADGTKVSRAGRLVLVEGEGSKACVPLFAPLYTKKGWAGGLLWLDPVARTVTTDHDAGWFVRWENPGKQGPDGFHLLLDACGGFYSSATALAVEYFFSAKADEVAYHYAEGVAVPTAAPDGVSVAVAGARMTLARSLKPKKITTDGVAEYVYDEVNPANATLMFAARTGIFKGAFTLWYEYDVREKPALKGVKSPYSGILTPVRDAAFADLPAGMGHCLVPDNDPAMKVYRLKRSYPVWLEASE